MTKAHLITCRKKHIDTDLIDSCFRMVANLYDWKAPINSIILKEDRILVLQAIAFYTATCPTFTVFDDKHYRVKADGYRLGPAGDH